MLETGTKIVFQRDGTSANDIAFERGDVGFVIESSEDGFYKINHSGQELEGIVADDFTIFSSNIHDAVNAKLDADEATREFKDSENRIIHAKKYKAAYSKINLETISEIEKNEGLAETLVIKDKVFEKLDIEKQQTSGVSSAIAFLKTKLREVFPNKPNKNSPEARKVYLYYVQYILANIMDVKVRQGMDFSDAITQMYNDTMKLYMIALDETGMLEDKILMQEETIKDKIFEAAQLVMKHTDELQKLENELIQKFGEDAINQTYAIDNIYNIKHRPNSKYTEGTDFQKRYDEIADRVIEGIKHVKYLTVNEIPTIVKQFVYDLYTKKGYSSSKTVDEINRDSYLYRNTVNHLLIEIFGDKWQRYLSSNGAYSTKSQKSSYYTQAEEYLPIASTDVEYNQNIVAKKKQEYIELNKFKVIFERKDPTELATTIKALIILKQDKSFGYYWPWMSKAMFYKYHNGYAVFLALYLEGWKVNKKQVVKLPENIEEYIVFANKSLEYIEKQESKLLEEIQDYQKQLDRSTTEEDWSWAGKKKATTTTEKRVDIRINSQTPLSHIERTNAIKIEEFTTNDQIQTYYKEVLGIDRITYGKYLPDEERQAHAYHFAMAIVDFCELLNWNIKDFTKQLDLGMAFAAAGSGSASAFYASAPAAFINLTRRRGDGSLSHEFTHYIDNFISKERGFGTDWNIGTTRSYRVRIPNTTKSSNLNHLIFDLFYLIKFARTPSSMPSSYVNQHDLWREDAIKSMEERGIKPKTTSGLIWYRCSSALSGYWTRNWELFARASECFFFDKLNERNQFNNYLVSGEYFDSPYGVYPTGPERKMTNYLLEQIYAAIKIDFQIGDFTYATTDRTDNFIAFDETDTKTEDAEESVEYPSEDDFRRQSAEKKIDDFIALLNQYKEGGMISNLRTFVNTYE